MALYNIEEISGEVKLHYSEKLKLVNLDLCPYQIPADSWKNDPTEFIIYHLSYLSLFSISCISWRIYKRIHEKQKELRFP